MQCYECEKFFHVACSELTLTDGLTDIKKGIKRFCHLCRVKSESLTPRDEGRLIRPAELSKVNCKYTPNPTTDENTLPPKGKYSEKYNSVGGTCLNLFFVGAPSKSIIDALDFPISSYRCRLTIDTRSNKTLSDIPVSHFSDISTVSVHSSKHSSWLKNVLQPSASLGSHSLSCDAVGTTPFEPYKKSDQNSAASTPVKQDDNTKSLALDLNEVLTDLVQDQNRFINEQKSLIAQLGKTNAAYRAIIRDPIKC